MMYSPLGIYQQQSRNPNLNQVLHFIKNKCHHTTEAEGKTEVKILSHMARLIAKYHASVNSLVGFFVSSKSVEFLHVAFDIIEKHCPIFILAISTSFSSNNVCKKASMFSEDSHMAYTRLYHIQNCYNGVSFIANHHYVGLIVLFPGTSMYQGFTTIHCKINC